MRRLNGTGNYQLSLDNGTLRFDCNRRTNNGAEGDTRLNELWARHSSGGQDA